jgi:hypothetical protein
MNGKRRRQLDRELKNLKMLIDANSDFDYARRIALALVYG